MQVWISECKCKWKESEWIEAFYLSERGRRLRTGIRVRIPSASAPDIPLNHSRGAEIKVLEATTVPHCTSSFTWFQKLLIFWRENSFLFFHLLYLLLGTPPIHHEP